MSRGSSALAPPAERALVVAVDVRDPARPLEPELAEFEALIVAAGATLAGRVVQRLDRVDPATLVGSGKAQEIAEIAESSGATKVFVFNDLRPRQRTNLEKIVPLPIVDRTMVILDIFAQRARSREGKLQVELAQLRYMQANLIGASSALSRLGGGVGTRGPGETKLEVDRRKIQSRVSLLRGQLDDVSRSRATRRQPAGATPLVALVGYTNVGKSSLLNRLSHAVAGDGAFVANQPFATLDPTLRRVYLAPERFVRLADTVGFITELPKELVAAFRATLEELSGADVLVHVLDGSNPDWPRQKASVDEILRELELEEKPTILAFNKTDARPPDAPPLPPDAIAISAQTGLGLDKLRAAIVALLLLSSCAPKVAPTGDPFVATYRALRPAVVLFTMTIPSDDPKRARKGERDDAYGTGFVVESNARGSRILTAEHVIHDARDLRATLDERRVVPAHVIAADEKNDLALVGIDVPHRPVAHLGKSANVDPGTQIGIAGYPVPDAFQDEHLVTKTSVFFGRVSSVRNDTIELDLPVIPGESGGPVFLADSGSVIALAQSRFDDEHAIGFGIPIEDAIRFLRGKLPVDTSATP